MGRGEAQPGTQPRRCTERRQLETKQSRWRARGGNPTSGAPSSPGAQRPARQEWSKRPSSRSSCLRWEGEEGGERLPPPVGEPPPARWIRTRSRAAFLWLASDALFVEAAHLHHSTESRVLLAETSSSRSGPVPPLVALSCSPPPSWLAPSLVLGADRDLSGAPRGGGSKTQKESVSRPLFRSRVMLCPCCLVFLCFCFLSPPPRNSLSLPFSSCPVPLFLSLSLSPVCPSLSLP